MSDVKLTGLEFKTFYKSDWGDPEAFCDGMGYEVDGQEVDDIDEDTLPDTSQVRVFAGEIFVNDKVHDAVRFIKRWKKSQHTAFLSVQIPKEREEEFRSVVRNLFGGSVSNV